MVSLPNFQVVLYLSIVMVVESLSYIKNDLQFTTMPNDIPFTTLNVNLDNNEITQLSVRDLQNLTSLVNLTLQYNKISMIEPGSFKNMINLKLLHLNGNQITILHKSVFQDLKLLQELSLATNRINLVEIGALGMPFLQVLDISQNKMKTIPDISSLANLRYLKIIHNELEVQTPVCGALKRLETLKMRKNEIVSIPDEFFHECVQIYSVNYKSNQLTSAKWISSLPPTVTEILISNNQISGSIQSQWFTNLRNLQIFELSSNQVDSFDFASLSYLPALETLDLINNQITFLGDPYLWCSGKPCNSLEIKMRGNTLPCNSSLCWDKHFSGVILKRDDCFGKIWSSVTMEDLQCKGEYNVIHCL